MLQGSFVITLLISVCVAQTYKGYYWWTWNNNPAPTNTNLGIAFSGWVDPNNALRDSAHLQNSLPGVKYISLGGGNANGRWTATALSSINTAINNGLFAGYNGIVYDVEEGDSGLASAFETSFKTAKSKGFKVLVSVSHSTPYGIADGSSLMNSFLSSTSIDLISPQLYTTGTEQSNDYTENPVSWTQWKTSKIPIVVSINTVNLYNSAVTFFRSKGIELQGYILWNNNQGASKAWRCGVSWEDANSRCDKSCTITNDCTHLGTAGQCFADLAPKCNYATEEKPASSFNLSGGLSPIAIGLISTLILIGILLVVVSIVHYKKKNNNQNVEEEKV